jgi:hypothetical protein
VTSIALSLTLFIEFCDPPILVPLINIVKDPSSGIPGKILANMSDIDIAAAV